MLYRKKRTTMKEEWSLISDAWKGKNSRITYESVNEARSGPETGLERGMHICTSSSKQKESMRTSIAEKSVRGMRQVMEMRCRSSVVKRRMKKKRQLLRKRSPTLNSQVHWWKIPTHTEGWLLSIMSLLRPEFLKGGGDCTPSKMTSHFRWCTSTGRVHICLGGKGR